MVKTSESFGKKPESFLFGGSKNPPTYFLWPCINAHLGCSFKANYGDHVAVHQLQCSSDPEYWTWVQNKPRYTCQHESGCSQSFASKKALREHVEQTHLGKSKAYERRCSERDCDPSIVYTTERQYREHRDNVHYGFSPMKCPVEGCKSSYIFQSHQNLAAHIRQNHKIYRTELNQLLPYRQKLNIDDDFEACHCPVRVCKHPTKFFKKNSLIKHIMTMHGKPHGEAVRIVG